MLLISCYRESTRVTSLHFVTGKEVTGMLLPKMYQSYLQFSIKKVTWLLLHYFMKKTPNSSNLKLILKSRKK